MLRTWMAAAALGAVLAGCGGEEERTLAEGTVRDPATGEEAQVEVRQAGDAETPAVRVTTPEGETVIRTGRDVEEVSQALGLPVYPGAQVTQSVMGSGTTGVGAMLVLQAPDPPERVAAFYKEAAQEAGFEIVSEAALEGMRVLGAAKGEQRLAVQVAPGGGGGSTVSLVGGEGR